MAISINIGSKLDTKGFKQADSATRQLSKNVKNLAGAMGIAFSATAVIAFGKASAKAFIEDDNAARSLGITLKNLGLDYGGAAANVNSFISQLEKTTGVLDDELRPAMDRLLRATGSVTDAQKLLGLALDISAGTGKDLTTVSQGLQKAYLGNNASLGRLGVGLSKAELTSSTFLEIQTRLGKLFAGQASSAAESYAGQMDKLTVAANNAKETIGKGLVQALVEASSSGNFDDTISGIDKLATRTEDFVVYLGRQAQLIAATPSLFDLATGNFDAFKEFKKTYDKIGALEKADALRKFRESQKYGGTYGDIFKAKAAAAAGLKRQKELLALTKKGAAAELAKTKAKAAAAAIDKANLALARGGDIFDMDKIQIQAALTSQAEALGKATTASQVLAIANDTARLKVKQDILALEDAIASKDTAAITAATAKLNEDMKVLGVLGQQNVKLLDIKKVLDLLGSKDLINLANLNEALRLVGLINLASTGTKKPPADMGNGSLGAGIPMGDFIAPIPKSDAAKASIDAIIEYGEAAAARANAFADLLDMKNASDAAALMSGPLASSIKGSSSAAPVINIYANTIANPDELTNMIQDSLIKLNKRGDYITTAGAL